MLSKCTAEDCGQKLKPGTDIMQLSIGRYVGGYITPTGMDRKNTKNWHVECFREFRIKEQALPYRCQSCHRRVKPGEGVVYVSRGKKPSAKHIRVEQRGHTLFYVAHERCAG
jgi:ribosomal protein L24E